MKKFLFVLHKPPHGSVNGQEALDAILMGSAFTQCTVLLLGDAIYQLIADQETGQLGTKDYSVTYQALADYGVTDIFCRQSHLLERNLTVQDLLIPVQAITDDASKQMLLDHNVILTF